MRHPGIQDIQKKGTGTTAQHFGETRGTFCSCFRTRLLNSTRSIIGNGDYRFGYAAVRAGSRLGFDVMNSSMLSSPYTRSWVEMQAQSGAPWIGAMDDPESFLSSRGWKAVMTQAGQPEANHERWKLPVFPTKAPNFPHNWWVTAAKKADA